MPYIKKRGGQKEEYDPDKIKESCQRAARNAGLSEEEASRISENVAEEITQWIDEKRGITTTEIQEKVIEELKKHNEKVAFMYESHLDVS